MSTIQWDSLESGFCESVVSGPPEYGGSFSSLAMSLFGLMGLFISRNHNILLRIVSSSLAVTGIGSFGYHWTLHAGWGLLDAYPMLVASWLGAYMGSDCILYRKVSVDRNSRRNYELWSGFLSLIFMSFLIASLALTVVEGFSSYFTLLFLISELVIALNILIIRFYSHRDMAQTVQGKKAFKYMYIGFGTAIFAAVIWFIVENLCPQPKYHWMRFLHAHSLWHVGISVGMYYLIQFFIFIHLYDVGQNPVFIERDGWFIFNIFPAVEYNKIEERLVSIKEDIE